MFRPPSAQDEWVMLFAAEMTSRGLSEPELFISVLGRELYPTMRHLPAAQALLVTYVQMVTPAEGVLEERERVVPD